jgi:hypothetical protein
MLPPESLQALDGTARGDTPPRRLLTKLDLVSACSVLDSIVIYQMNPLGT